MHYDTSLSLLVKNAQLITNYFHFHAEMSSIINKIECRPIKGGNMKAKIYHQPPTICIKNITKNCDEEYLKLYFGNTKRSGGGSIKNIEFPQKGEAIITFQDANGMIIFMLGSNLLSIIYFKVFKGKCIDILTFGCY